MFGVLITRCLLMLFGYAYPAFESYKTLEKNKRSYDIEELRFWCKYWIIVAIFTVVERISDILISWIPVYGEMKLAFLIYLWHPKTKGTGHVYGTILQPYLVKNEPEIERMLLECKVRAWDFAFILWRNCSEFGHSTFLKALNYAADFQSTKFKNSTYQRNDQQAPMASPPPPSDLPAFNPQSGEQTADSPSPVPPSDGRINRVGSETHQTDGGETPHLGETENVNNEEDKPASPYPRARLRRVKPLS